MLRIFLNIEAYPISFCYFVVSFLHAFYYITSNDRQLGCPIHLHGQFEICSLNYNIACVKRAYSLILKTQFKITSHNDTFVQYPALNPVTEWVMLWSLHVQFPQDSHTTPQTLKEVYTT